MHFVFCSFCYVGCLRQWSSICSSGGGASFHKFGVHSKLPDSESAHEEKLLGSC